MMSLHATGGMLSISTALSSSTLQASKLNSTRVALTTIASLWHLCFPCRGRLIYFPALYTENDHFVVIVPVDSFFRSSFIFLMSHLQNKELSSR